MAVSTSSKFSIAAGSPPQVVGAFDKFAKDATPKYPCGYKVEMADGTVLRYAHFGDDVNRGVLVSQDLSESSLVETDGEVIAPASCVNTSDGTIGSYFIEANLASVTVDQYAGAKLLILDDVGAGYTYDIIGNTATNDPATGNIRIQLAQPLQVALDATTDIGIRGNRYANLETADAADIDLAGVSCSAMVVTTAAWGWIQTKGVVAILADGTIDDGDIITLSDGTAGAVQTIGGGGTTAADLVSEPIIGFCVETGVSGEYSGHIINLE
jgi:hypothetical protein